MDNRPLRLAALISCVLLLSHCGGEDEASGPPLEIVDGFPGLKFTKPLFLTAAPGDDSRLFVVTQPGTIFVFANDPATTATKVFLDLTSRTLSNGERGLLGLAFDPDYQDNGLLYVNFTPRTRGVAAPLRTDIVRYGSDRADTVNPQSEKVILSIPQPSFNNHKGGWLGFGPDGFLYIATGDGGGEGDPGNNAQNRGSLLGKILRIDRNGLVPRDNPFPAATMFDSHGSVWALGLRNPYRASFDRETGELWAADAGENAREEVNVITRGGNYGWRKFEGSQVFNADDPDPGNTVAPVYEYAHEQDRCAIIGGYVYRGTALGAGYQGRYFFADNCTGEVFVLSGGNARVVGVVPGHPSSFGEDGAGELYITSYDGHIYRIQVAAGA